MFIYIGISICLCGGYYYCTIAANSFSGDQYTMIEQTKEILETDYVVCRGLFVHQGHEIFFISSRYWYFALRNESGVFAVG